MKAALVTMLALTLAAAGARAEVWRCGPDGTRFQAVPCADGRPVALKAAPDAAAVQEAQDVARRERDALRTLAEERRVREREAAERGLGPAAIRPLEAAERPSPARRPAGRSKGSKAPAWPTATSSAPAG